MYVGVLENNPEDVKLRVSILFSFANYLPLKVSKHFNLICTYKLKKMHSRRTITLVLMLFFLNHWHDCDLVKAQKSQMIQNHE